MSLVLTELSNAGIAMVADSAISMIHPATSKTETHQKDWLKLLPVRRIKAAVSYWGNIGAISGKQPFDEWLAVHIKSAAYTDLPSFADFLATKLNAACGHKPLPHEQCAGVHVAGYHKWQDGVPRPTFYHVHNGHGHIAMNYSVGMISGQPVLTGMSPKWEGEKRRLFQAHLDFPSPNRPLDESISTLNNGFYITRNGDFFPYLIISDGLNFTCGALALAGISLPRDPEKLTSRVGYLSLVMQTVIAIYQRSSMPKLVGGHVTALGITPDRGYLCESTRKSKFISRRAAELDL